LIVKALRGIEQNLLIVFHGADIFRPWWELRNSTSVPRMGGEVSCLGFC
jgi:hypothetical protein